MTLYFDDYDALATAARGWNFEFVQLDNGPFSGTIDQTAGENVSVTRFRFNRKFRQFGQISQPARTFAVFIDPTTPLIWMDGEFGANDLCLFAKDGAFESVSYPGFDAASVTISDALLENVAELHGLQRQVEALPAFGAGYKVDPRYTARLRIVICTVLADLAASHRAVLEHTAAQLVLEALDHAQLRNRLPSSRSRDRAFRTALELVHDGYDHRLTVQELCQRTHTSERTLRYAFQEHLGVSPKTYLKALSLQRVREDLKQDKTGDVLRLAGAHGYLHSGQFAKDYRTMFGELPSETRRRS